MTAVPPVVVPRRNLKVTALPEVPMVMSTRAVSRTAYCGASTMSLGEVAMTVSAEPAGEATTVKFGAGMLSGDGT